MKYSLYFFLYFLLVYPKKDVYFLFFNLHNVFKYRIIRYIHSFI